MGERVQHTIPMYKHYDHEGGISTPLIVHWPAGFKDKDAFRQQVGHVIDFMPTIIELAGATYPNEANGHPILPMEGKSLVPAFADKPIERDGLYWEHENNRAVRSGRHEAGFDCGEAVGTLRHVEGS